MKKHKPHNKAIKNIKHNYRYFSSSYSKITLKSNKIKNIGADAAICTRALIILDKFYFKALLHAKA